MYTQNLFSLCMYLLNVRRRKLRHFKFKEARIFASQFIKGENVADSLLKTFNKMYVARGDFNLFLKICIVIPRKWFRCGDLNS